jgi:hypothetical protein
MTSAESKAGQRTPGPDPARMECSWNARAFPQMRHDGLCMKSVVQAEDYTKEIRTVGYYCENTVYGYYRYLEFIFSIQYFESLDVKARYFDFCAYTS